MSNRAGLVARIATAVVLAACSRGEATWNCSNSQKLACSEWSASGVGRDVTANQQQNCVGMGGTVGQGRCPDANVVGVCVPRHGGGGRVVYYTPRGVSDTQRICKQLGGTWRWR